MCRPLPALLICALLAACGSGDGDDGSELPEVIAAPGVPAEVQGDGFGAATGAPPGASLPFQIAHGAFPAAGGNPNALVYIPTGFDPARPLQLVVFLHGFNNCVTNVIRPVNGTCTAGGAVHNAYNLANQLEATRLNALLLVPELAFEQATSADGQLGTQDGFLHLVDDVLAALGPRAGNQSSGQIDKIAVLSHSGGYQAAADIVSKGGLAVDELYLLDSLYADDAVFDAWVKAAPTAFAPRDARFATVYTLGGGTLDNSQAMAGRAAAWPLGAGTIIDDRTTSTFFAGEYAHGLIFKRTALAHDDVPRYYFGRLLATGKLADKP